MQDKLPNSVLIAISDLLPTASDYCNLSATCRRMRDALAPSIFRSVRATNLAQDAAAVHALFSAHGHHIRKVRYQCMLHGNPVTRGSSAVENPTR
ncbi:hypothetical protein DFJ73DRAFT_787755 [Zopfochytrium polystomum]|nr:hypothetical protein DFJ73DRAFT_787755 [Zopfochytrium polystomum]